MFINKNNKIETTKLLMPIISVKMPKLIPTVLLASILAISFSLVCSNAFASQGWESPIAKFTYPDNWNIVQIIGNGEGISLQPANELNVYMHQMVYQDSANGFGRLVDDIIQRNINNGFETLIQENMPGKVIILKKYFMLPNYLYSNNKWDQIMSNGFNTIFS